MIQINITIREQSLIVGAEEFDKSATEKLLPPYLFNRKWSPQFRSTKIWPLVSSNLKDYKKHDVSSLGKYDIWGEWTLGMAAVFGRQTDHTFYYEGSTSICGYHLCAPVIILKMMRWFGEYEVYSGLKVSVISNKYLVCLRKKNVPNMKTNLPGPFTFTLIQRYIVHYWCIDICDTYHLMPQLLNLKHLM